MGEIDLLSAVVSDTRLARLKQPFCAGQGRQAFGRLHQAIKVAIAPTLIHAAVRQSYRVPAKSKMLVLQYHLPTVVVVLGTYLLALHTDVPTA